MPDAFICAYVRTPIGRYGGALSSIRTDDLGAVPITALMERHASVDWNAVDEVAYGCANQAGEDNRNVARMCALLAGLPETVPGTTINRLCGSGMDAVAYIARAIKAGEMEMGIAGGVESMSRAPFVIPKATSAFSRMQAEMHDTTIGWRFVNPLMKARHGIESMPETGENVAEDYDISRADQDAFALRSQQRAAAAMEDGRLAEEIAPVTIPRRKGEPIVVDTDEHPRADTTVEALAKLSTPFRAGGTVDGGQRVGRQRRCRRPHRRVGSGGEAAWPHPDRPRGRHRDGRCLTPHHGHRAALRRAEADGADGDRYRCLRHDRAQRSLRQPSACDDARPRPRR